MFRRIRRGWELTKKAWGVVRAHPGLIRFPVTGGVLALVIAVVLMIPGIVLAATESAAPQVAGVVLIVIGAYLATFVVNFYNVGLAAAADDALQGDEPDIAAARATARTRVRVIAGWAAVSIAMSALVTVVRDRAGPAGGLLASVGGAIWSLVTFLVVPVLAFEGVGPNDAVKRSAHLFRERWGQQVTGNLAIGGIAGLAVVFGVLLAVAGVALITVGSTGAEIAGAVLTLVGAVVAIAGAVFAGATRGVFGVALYRYVATDTATGPFTSTDLESAARAG